MLRLTWVQPEDLVGHELRQAALDGREASAVAARWHAAGGPRPRSPPAPRPARSPATSGCWRTTCWTSWPSCPARSPTTSPPTSPRSRRCARVAPLPGAPAAWDGPVFEARLEAAWLGRAAGCLLGKPVEKLPLDAIRALARAAGNWPLTGWFTARGVPAELLAEHPWNRRSAATSLAENIDGMPEDDDLNYPLLALLVLRRHGRRFTTADVARVWLDELPAGAPSPPSASPTATCSADSNRR